MINLNIINYHYVLLVHAGLTLFMVGLIWMIQVVHYPLFALIDTKNYQQYQQVHMQKITWIVAPVMIAELICGFILINLSHTHLVWIAFFLLGVIWLNTLFLQVPAHGKLSKSWNSNAHTHLTTLYLESVIQSLLRKVKTG
jgi:hypothetical protein